jgi:hypothetical protein
LEGGFVVLCISRLGWDEDGSDLIRY